MIIKIDQHHEIEYANGFWNVNIHVENDFSHHLTKNDIRTYTDNCGDFNRCLNNLILRQADDTNVSKLLDTYIKCLNMFKKADTYTFEDKVTWSFDDMKATTNKNYHGVLLDYQYLSTHNKPTSEQFTASTHKGAAKKILNVDVYRHVKEPTLDSLCDAMLVLSEQLAEKIESANRVATA